MRFRHQLPVHSPLTAGAIIGAVRASLAAAGGDALEAELQARIRDRYAADDVVLTNSGTAALTLALGALQRAGRGPVALPAYSCFDIATAAIGAGIDVLLYDVSPDTLGPEPASLRAALGAGARSIVVAYLYGYPVDLDAVSAMAEEFDAVIVEDAAQGAGGTWRSRPLGSFGSASVLSFGRGKGTTGGGGGALLWRKAAVAELGSAPRPETDASGGVRSVVATAAQWVLARPSVYGLPASLPFLHLGDTVYKEPTVPLGASRFSVALVGRTWGLAEAEVRERKATAASLIAALSPVTGFGIPAPVVGGEPGYLRLPIVFDDGRRVKAGATRARCLGIMPGYPISLDELQQLRHVLRNAGTAFRGASELACGLFTLPTHGMVRTEDVRRLVDWLGE